MEVSFAHPILENQESTQASLWEDDKHWRGTEALACGPLKGPKTVPGTVLSLILLEIFRAVFLSQNDIPPSPLLFLFEFLKNYFGTGTHIVQTNLRLAM